MSELISVNQLLHWPSEDSKGATERVVWIDDGHVLAYTIDISSKNAFPKPNGMKKLTQLLEAGSVVLLDETKNGMADEDRICGKAKLILDRAWEIVSAAIGEDGEEIYRREKRGSIVKQVAKRFNVTEKTVYFHLRRFWQRGRTKGALVPDYNKCGGPGMLKAVSDKKRGRPRKYPSIVGNGINVDEDTKRDFRVAIKRYYETWKESSLRVTYNLMLKDFYGIDKTLVGETEVPILESMDRIPSYEQFEYWFNKEKDTKRTIITRKGQKEYDLNSRPLSKSSNDKSQQGPGYNYQIDATVADVYLVSSYNRQWIIGRPVIYVLIDVFSRMIVGLYVGLEGPSWLGAMMALVNAGTDKVKFCQEYDIEISEAEWPCKYMPKIVIADRGEMISDNSDSLADSLDVKVKYAPPYRADLKGIVERYFRTIQEKVKPFLPGYVIHDLKTRGGRDYRLDAKLTIQEFTKIILLCVIKYNNNHYMEKYSRDELMIEEDLEPIPIKLWNWGCANRSGKLRFYGEKFIKLCLMPRDTALVTRTGIVFKKRIYTCKRAIREQWYVKANADKGWHVDISYDPRNMDFIYIRDAKDLNLFEKCHLRNDQNRNKTLDEINYLIAQEGMKQQQALSNTLQSEVVLSAMIESIVKEGAQKAKETDTGAESNASKTKQIRNHRKLEQEKLRANEAFELEDGSDDIQEAGVHQENASKPKGGNPVIREKLRKRMEERLNGEGA